MAVTIHDWIKFLKESVQKVKAGDFDLAARFWRGYADNQKTAKNPGPNSDPDFVLTALQWIDDLHDEAGFLLAKKAEALGLDSTPFLAANRDRCQRAEDSETLLRRMQIILANEANAKQSPADPMETAPPTPPPDPGMKGAFYRNRYFAELREQGSKPAGIMKTWNSLPMKDRKEKFPKWHNNVSSPDTVKKALHSYDKVMKSKNS
ncbi:MAG: hypothetical protein IT426_21005 [Pirellulales bacterium]|nr:hypothetical protein [Pirellulales bacterium]